MKQPSPLPFPVGSSWAVVLAVPIAAYLLGAFARPTPLGGFPQRDRTIAANGAIHRERPAAKADLDALLGGAIRVIGSDVPDVPLSRGSRLTTRFFFSCEKPLDRDWQIFVHVDARGTSYRLHGDHFPARGKAPTTAWQPGTFIVDTWERAIPMDMPAGSYDIWLGFYIGNERLPFSGGDSRLHDGDNRIRVGTLTIE